MGGVCCGGGVGVVLLESSKAVKASSVGGGLVSGTLGGST